MKRSTIIPTATVLFTCLLGIYQTAQAGKILYAECFTARGDMADGVKAALVKDGLFYTWGGFSVKGTVVEGAPCNPVNLKAGPDLFRAEDANGKNSITAALSKNVQLDGLMHFRSIRNNQPLDKDPMKTTFTLKGNDIATKIGPAATVARLKDPVIDITNDGISVMSLLSIIAQIYNSEDPLDPNLSFDPDGNSVTVTPTLLPSNMNLLPGDTAEFMFPLNGSPNWSFQYSYTYSGDVYTDLLASNVVPEPNSLSLLLAGIVVLVILRACSVAWARGQQKGPYRAGRVLTGTG